jgi:hypothetical protein
MLLELELNRPQRGNLDFQALPQFDVQSLSYSNLNIKLLTSSA